MDFFNQFLELNDSEFLNSQTKQLGVEIDYFSRIYGMMLIVGHVTYNSVKNYRSKSQFNNFVSENTVDIPVVIMLFELADENVSIIESIDNMFINRYSEIDETYFKSEHIKMFGYLKPARRRKNGKKGKSFKVHRGKKFVIHTNDLIYKDCDNKFYYAATPTLNCTFRSKLL